MARLIMLVTKSDPRITQIVAPMLSSVYNCMMRKYWEQPDLSGISGDNGSHGLFLVGHANAIKFTEVYGTYDKVSGDEVIENLVAWGLDIGSFAYCLLAGCSAAPLNHLDGLISQVGRKSGLKTIGSSTTVLMAGGGDRVSLTPQDSGQWVVEDPNGRSLFLRNDGVFIGNLDRPPLTSQKDIMEKMKHSPFKLMSNGGDLIV